jgi:hypothetical protein
MSETVPELELMTRIYNYPMDDLSKIDRSSPLDEIFDTENDLPEDSGPPQVQVQVQVQLVDIFTLKYEIGFLMNKLKNIKETYYLNTIFLLNKKRKRDNGLFHEKNNLNLKREEISLISKIKNLKNRQSILESTNSVLFKKVYRPNNKKFIVKPEEKDDTFLNKFAKEIIEIKNTKSQHFRVLDMTFKVLLKEFERNV